MDAETLGAHWRSYLDRGVIRDIDERDTMWSGGKKWYWDVGQSAIKVLCSSLVATPLTEVTRVLDFGCGWGRVARHLRAFFPNAELFVSELNKPAAEFCATTFSGRVADEKALPENLDVIWVGSVFTHLDYERMKVLFGSLAPCLGKNGILVATFQGRRAIEMSKIQPYIDGKSWEKIVREYQSTGVGYASYGRPDLGDYGVSLTSVARVAALGEAIPDLRLLSYHEGGWANHQDAVAWVRQPLALPGN